MDKQELTMPTKYEPQRIEQGRYEWWLKGKFFEAKNDEKKSLIRLSSRRQTLQGDCIWVMHGIRRFKILLRA